MLHTGPTNGQVLGEILERGQGDAAGRTDSTFGEGGLFSSSEKESARSPLCRACLSVGSEADTSLWAGEDEQDFFSDVSDSSWSSSGCSEVLPSLSESSSPSSGSSSSSPPLPWKRGRERKTHGGTKPQSHLLVAEQWPQSTAYLGRACWGVVHRCRAALLLVNKYVFPPLSSLTGFLQGTS